MTKIPFVDRVIREPKQIATYKLIEPLITDLEVNPQLAYPENIKAYFSNLESLGLIKIRRDMWASDEDAYEKLANKFVDYKYDIEKGLIEMTPFSTMFIQGCIEQKA